MIPWLVLALIRNMLRSLPFFAITLLVFVLFPKPSAAQSDVTPPRLVSFSISPTTVDVSRGPARMARKLDLFETAGDNPWRRR